MSLSALAAGTTYHYRERSSDAAANPGVSGNFTFATVATTSSGGGNGGGAFTTVELALLLLFIAANRPSVRAAKGPSVVSRR